MERDLSNVTYLVMGLAFKPNRLADSKVEILSHSAMPSYQVKLSCYSKMAVIPYISLALKCKYIICKYINMHKFMAKY